MNVLGVRVDPSGEVSGVPGTVGDLLGCYQRARVNRQSPGGEKGVFLLRMRGFDETSLLIHTYAER